MDNDSLTRDLKAEALRLGFDRVGVAPAVPAPGHARLLDWIASGHAAGMSYMERHADPRRDPANLLDGVRSIVVAAMVYGEPAPTPQSPSAGMVARYARGQDYHRVLWNTLEELLAWLRVHMPGVRGRAVADTAPLMERDYARLAGLGWIGKNTMLINRGLGSFTVLGALLLDCELVTDEPHHATHCGTCTRCLDACPTEALTSPYQLDARKCISYWTIEHRGPIGKEAAGELHGWVFGCDVCQDVCPWNRKAPVGRVEALMGRPEWTNPDLIAWLDRAPADWKAALRGTALARARRVGLVRNAALVLGDRLVAEAVPALVRRLADEEEDPVIRDAAAWALSRIGDGPALEALLRYTAQGSPAPRISAASVSLPRAPEEPNQPPG